LNWEAALYLTDKGKMNSDIVPGCVEALTRQQPFVNQALATQSLALLSRLFWHGSID
jgi:hypothetical protein